MNGCVVAVLRETPLLLVNFRIAAFLRIYRADVTRAASTNIAPVVMSVLPWCSTCFRRFASHASEWKIISPALVSIGECMATALPMINAVPPSSSPMSDRDEVTPADSTFSNRIIAKSISKTASA